MRPFRRIARLPQCGGAAGVLTVILLAAVLALGGCASSKSPEAKRVRTAYEDANPRCRLELEDHFKLAGLKLAVVRRLVRLSDDEDVVETLSHLRRVEIDTYRLVTSPECAAVRTLDQLERELESLGWCAMVTEHDAEEASWVFAHTDADGDLDGLFVVTIDADELEVVRLEGRIERMLADAIADDPGDAATVVGFAR